MKNRIKALTMLDGKKRYILMGLLALELLSIPAAAQIVHRVAFEVRPQVVAVEVPTAEPGVSRFLVSSNDGFGVAVSDLIGRVDVSVHESGTIAGGQRFGDAAQLPGAARICAQSQSPTDTPIYAATRKTAASPAEVVDQAVIFEFRYSPSAQPDFAFTPGPDTARPHLPCSDVVG